MRYKTIARLLLAIGFLSMAFIVLSGLQVWGNGKLNVLATTGMIGDAVRHVGGEKVEVTVLMPPGSDPHTYKIRAGDIGRIGDAEIIFYNGLHLEANFHEALEDIEKAESLGGKLDKELLISSNDGKTAFDPHIWLDVELWIKVLPIIYDALVKHRPKYVEYFAAGLDNAVENYGRLHEDTVNTVNRIPPSERYLVTAHPVLRQEIRNRGVWNTGAEYEIGSGNTTYRRIGEYDRRKRNSGNFYGILGKRFWNQRTVRGGKLQGFQT